MRRAAFGLLVATTLGGCNWVFGLDATTSIPDAPDAPPADAAWASIHLGFLQQTFDASSTVPQPIEAPFPDLVRLEVGPAEGATVMRTSENGIVTIPPDISGAPFRLVYQRLGDTVHEYQGLVPEAHVIEALFGPVNRVAPPGGAGFAITPTSGFTGNHPPNRVFTVGTWTEGTRLNPPAGSLLDYDYQPGITSSMSGALGIPAATDRGVLVDYNQVGPCRTSIGSTDFPPEWLALRINPSVAQWVTDPANPLILSSTDSNSVAINPEIAQFGENLNSEVTTENYGFIPSAVMPGFTRPPDYAGRQIALRNPLMIVLRSCSALDSQVAVREPTLLKDKLVRALYSEVTVARAIAGGGSVDSGVAVLTLPGANFDVRTLVAFAKDVKLKTPSAMIDLMGATDDVPVPATTGTLTLTWNKYKTNEVADFWEVTLSAVNNTSINKKRIYTTTTTEVKIQGSELDAGKRYIVQISAFTGRPGAATGDFRSVQGSQAMSVLFPRTFVIQ